MKTYVIGAGVGDEELMTIKARFIINSADIVLTTKRLFDELSHLSSNIISMSIDEIISQINSYRNTEKNIAVIASGDVCFYSIANTIKNKCPGIQLEYINGLSSLQYLCSKLLTSYDDAKLISIHGREKSIVPFVTYNKKVFSLTGGKYKAHDLISDLIKHNLTDVQVSVGENLSSPTERIIKGTPDVLKDLNFADLSVMLIENTSPAYTTKHIKDEDFIRGKSPMSKECVRTVSISKLDIKPNDIVFDIGSGTGSVTIEMAKKANESIVYAIEKQDYAIELIHQNIKKHKIYNITTVNDIAPDGLLNLPIPDKVFIGGSTGNLDKILEVIYSKNSETKIVINAVTIETLSEAVALFKNLNKDVEISCLNVSESTKLGNYNLMKALNPVYIICTI